MAVVVDDDAPRAAQVGDELARRGVARAAGARREGRWSAVDDLELERRFEAAAATALRVPALAERSTYLRQVGRRVVPERLRPTARRAATTLDRALAAAVARGGRLRGGR